ncbi:MAG: class I SAM-dependent methyltransferase [Chloroflexi bacterium]|nr:class I SAM-dependent methyltransferase [Chloroflexota bacterium]
MTKERKVDLYDELGADYDLMIDWKARLKNEMPFFRKLFAERRVRRVLDSACATGMHAITLAGEGYEATGADPSAEMVAKARANAAARNADVRFVQAGFGELADKTGRAFDAILCLGNSLPHVLSDTELDRTLADMNEALADHGILIIQNRNYDKIWPEKIKYMPLNTAVAGGRELLFFRMLEFHQETMTFSIVTFEKSAGQWSYRVSSTTLRPMFRPQLAVALRKAGFSNLSFYGDYQFTPFQKDETMDLIIVAAKD